MANKKSTKTKIFFAHSAGPQYRPGKGSYDLVKYLKSNVLPDFQIIFPIIEKPNSPTYDKFKKMFKVAFAKITEPFILVGHSLGASTLLKYLSEERPDVKILALFLISTPHWKSDMKEFQLKQSFSTSLKDISKIFLYHSKEDTELPIDNLEYYENAFKTVIVHKLNGNDHTFPKGLPELVSDIKSLDI